MPPLDLNLPPELAELVPPLTTPDPRECPPLRWGIIGPGGIAHKFARNVASATACRVTAVASRERERAERFAHEHGIPAAVEGYGTLAEREDVDAVYVATPHSAHRDAALLAIAAGKHVLVEKAFTRNAAEAREVVAAAREAGVFCMEAMWTRFLPRHVVARHLVRSGLVGDVVQIVADHGQPLTHIPRLVRPELAGGALLDLGVYPISFIVGLLGRPDAVDAFGHLWETGVDVSSVTHLTYPGASGVATTTMLAPTPTRAFVGGTDGWIALDTPFYGPGGLEVLRRGWEAPVRWSGVPDDGGFEFQVAEAARCVAEGLTESPVLPLDETVAIMEIMDAVRASLGVRFPGEG
ncbi:MAG: Gfo/Idh/MocA family oxidoreductase [bacterium]|nr:Gfo/Idh/MocA family oxidoreductase [bacterium]